MIEIVVEHLHSYQNNTNFAKQINEEIFSRNDEVSADGHQRKRAVIFYACDAFRKDTCLLAVAKLL